VAAQFPPGGGEVVGARDARAGDQHGADESRRARTDGIRLPGSVPPAPPFEPRGDDKGEPGPDRAAQQHVGSVVHARAHPGPGNCSRQRYQQRRQVRQLAGGGGGERERRRRVPGRERGRAGPWDQRGTVPRPLAAERRLQHGVGHGGGDGHSGQPACRAAPGPPPTRRQQGADRHPQQRMVRGAAEQHEEPVRALRPGLGPAADLAALGGRMAGDCMHAFMVGTRTGSSQRRWSPRGAVRACVTGLMALGELRHAG
jgi:hypothetical protein